MRTVPVNRIFTAGEIQQAIKLKAAPREGSLAQVYCEQIVTPILPRINRVTGQENDAMYFAYLLEHLINEHEHADRAR